MSYSKSTRQREYYLKYPARVAAQRTLRVCFQRSKLLNNDAHILKASYFQIAQKFLKSLSEEEKKSLGISIVEFTYQHVIYFRELIETANYEMEGFNCEQTARFLVGDAFDRLKLTVVDQKRQNILLKHSVYIKQALVCFICLANENNSSFKSKKKSSVEDDDSSENI